MIKHNVSIDVQRLQSKPAKDDKFTVPGIVDRLGRIATDAEVTINELMEAIMLPNGKSWSPATYTGIKDQNHWKSQGYFALDFDASDEIAPAKKEMFGDDFNEKITWKEVIARCQKTGVLPCAIHSSFSSDSSHDKYRVIFQLSETVTNPKIARSILYLLFLMFPESDISCATDHARFFYGGKELLWRDPANELDPYVLFEKIIPTIKQCLGYEIIKKNIRFNIGLQGIKSLTLEEYADLDDSERANCYEINVKNRVNVIYFIFEHIELRTAEPLKGPECDIVMDDNDKNRLAKALDYIDPSGYDAWYKVGMALKQTYGDIAKKMWMDWSKRAKNADDDVKLDKKWEQSLIPNGSLTVGTVYEFAKKGGWNPIPQTVKDFNNKFFHYINDSGSEVVVEEVKTEEKNRFGKVVKNIYLKENKRTAFVNYREGVRPIEYKKNGKDVVVNRAKYWLTHSKRKRIAKIVFKPKGDINPNEYNLWSNFETMKEYIPFGEVDFNKFLLYSKHLYYIISNGDRKVFDYILGWMAYSVQFPEKLPEVAIIMVGKQGTGKSLFVDLFGQIFGKHYICLQSEEALTGRFNSHLANKVLVFADEAVWKGDHKAVNKLKNNTTNTKINLEGKFKDMIDYDNYMHIIMASNNRTVLKIDPDDRRFFIVDLNDKWYKKKDESKEMTESRKKYFKDMVVQFNHEGGMEHFYSYLKHLDLSNFNIRDFPNTAIKDDHKMAALTPLLEGFLIEKLSFGILYETQTNWGCVKRTDFYNDYCTYIKLHNPKYADPLPNNIFGKELQRLLPDCVKITRGRIRVNSRDGFSYEQCNVYGFAQIDKCRKVFCNSINVTIKWEIPVKDEEHGILSTDGEYDFDKNASSDEVPNGERGHPKIEEDASLNYDAKDFSEDKKKTEITFEDGTTFSF